MREKLCGMHTQIHPVCSAPRPSSLPKPQAIKRSDQEGIDGIRFKSKPQLSPAPNTNNDQPDSGNHREGAQNRRNGQRICLLMRKLNRTDLGILFLMGKTNSAQGKTEDAEDNEENSDNRSYFHKPLIMGDAACGLNEMAAIRDAIRLRLSSRCGLSRWLPAPGILPHLLLSRPPQSPLRPPLNRRRRQHG